MGVGVEEVFVVFNGFGVVSVSLEGGVNVDVLFVNYFVGVYCDVVIVVVFFNFEEVVGLCGKGGWILIGFENGLGNGDWW